MHLAEQSLGHSSTTSHHMHATWSDWSIQVICTPPKDQDLLMPTNAVGAGFSSGGNVAWQIDGAPIRQGVIQDHDVFVFSHDEFKWLPTGRGHDCILVLPPASFLKCPGDVAKYGQSGLHRTEFQSDPTTHGILGLIRDEVMTGGQMGSMYQEALVNLLSLRIARNYMTKPQVTQKRVLRLNAAKQQRVLDYMRNSLSEEVTVGRLADLVPMSLFYFSRAFKETFGKSPYQYLTQLRMRHALVLLRTSKVSITEVAASVGYTSTTHFAAQFRRTWGFPPLDARVRHLSDNEARDAV